MPVLTKSKSLSSATLSATDRKVLVRALSDRVTDPDIQELHWNPSVAITKGVAVGAEGHKTGVYGYSEQSVGVCGESPVYAGFFKGEVFIDGDLNAEYGNTSVAQLKVAKNIVVGGDIQLTNADVAEDFDISSIAAVQPGTVMVFDADGALSESVQAYDNCVAGVISGAGGYQPGLVLDKQDSSQNRQPIALMGKVYCKVDAQFGPIAVGDLLTTSPTPGHAMKAADPARAFGAVIGKALRPIAEGRGLVPILVALQ